MFFSPVQMFDTVVSYAEISIVICVVLNSSIGGRIQLHGQIDKAVRIL